MMSTLFTGKRLQDWLLVLLAVGLFASPWLAGYRALPLPTWHAWVMAFLLAYISFSALAEARQWEEWVTLVFGIWLIAAPFVLGFSTDMAAARVHWLVGALTVAISLLAEWRFRHPFATSSKPGAPSL